jgi:uncharacterized protein YndB with AHSA1/START domain
LPARSKIEKKVLIQATPEVVFSALTDAKELAHWFCDRAVSDPREGGELTVHWKSARGKGRAGHAVFTAVESPLQVSLAWKDDGSRHSLTYTVHATRTSTEVSMVDEGDPFPDEEAFAFVNDGWNSVLLELKEHCEQRQRTGKTYASSGGHPGDQGD